jgi:vacuolar-type H+-ATPase subunit E/Vma4
MKDEREQDPGSHLPPDSGDASKSVPGNGGAEVSGKADELLEAAQRRGRGLLDRQKNAAGEELHSVADVMRGAARQFEEHQEAGVAGYVDKAADYVDRVSSTLRERDLEDLMVEFEDQLRRKPAVVLGAAAVVGFALGRFLRAGTQRIAKERRGGS